MNISLWIAALALALVAVPLGSAAEETRVFRLPSKSFLELDPQNPSAPAKLRLGVRLLPPQASTLGDAGPRYDVRESFAASGLDFLEATYFLQSGVLVVRAPEEKWNDVAAAVDVDAVAPDPGDSLRFTFTLVEFTATGEGVDLGKLGYRELRQKAGSTWRELRNVTFGARSGRRASASNTSTPAGKPARPRPISLAKEGEPLPPIADLGRDELGIQCIVEPQLAPDGRGCEVSYALQWRAAREESASRLESHIELLEDHPAVLQIDTAPASAGQSHRQRALVGAFHVMKLGDWREGQSPLATKPGPKPKN